MSLSFLEADHVCSQVYCADSNNDKLLLLGPDLGSTSTPNSSACCSWTLSNVLVRFGCLWLLFPDDRTHKRDMTEDVGLNEVETRDDH